jgi:uncharacterized protein (TIGR02594 family)
MSALKIDSQGLAVKQLQLLLNSHLKPFPGLRVDGNFGPRTEEALKLFQKSQGMPESGEADAETMQAFGQNPEATHTVISTSGAPLWMEIAEAELGIHENSLPGQHNKRIIEYHAATTLQAREDEVPWCASFVNWVMKQVGQTGTGSALAKSWLNWGQPLTTPRPGAITVIKKKVAGSDQATGSSTGFHVAFYVSSTPSHIQLLGGNQGDSVKFSNFPLALYDIKGYRWP